jgi:hypothetical protein
MGRVSFPVTCMGVLALAASAWAQTSACDLVSPFGTVDASDVQAAINMSLGVSACPSTLNIAGLGVCNAVMVQRVINAALGGACSTPTTHGVTLNWSASTSSNVAGYNVYRSTTSGSGYSKINSTLVTGLTYSDNAVQAGQTYFYVVTTMNTSNSESSYSTQVQGKVPTP